ncbi:MAG: MmgE/PrpD family protein [Proteobacteria bacterium]|nr:MmgE/PrpD family protein [Pseudomonadota bacterium]MDA1057759.1 MmgE/PrpD family protein [Pseudomonadota bacterium]
MSANIAQTFAQSAHRITPGSLPAEVRTKAKRHILDSIGNALAVSRDPFADTTMRALGRFGAGTHPVIGRTERLSLRDAMVANGALIHTLDYDDTHTPSLNHVSACAVPLILGLGAETGASGGAMLAAYVVACETAGRIGRAVNGGFHGRGFHATALCGTFGGALGAGHLLGLNPEQLAHAQGIALSYASGTNEWLADGAWTKRLHPGKTAVDGVTAAYLAAEGFIGVKHPYEGPRGLYANFLADGAPVDWDYLARGIDDDWEMLNVAIKPFPLCHANHAFTDCGIALHDKGLKATDIARVDALLHERQFGIVCEPESQKKNPSSAYEAQFSLPFSFAAGLVRGRFGLAELEPDCWGDPEILALGQKVHHGVDPDSAFPDFYSGEVVVTRNDGTVVWHREAVNRGTRERPLSQDEIVAKFHDNAAHGCDAAQAARIADCVLNLEDLKTGGTLAALVAREGD